MPIEDVVSFGSSWGMHFVSDGSIKGTKGAFGWESALPGGKWMMANSGPARGTQPGGSFRAEGCGQSSWLRFIKHVQMHTQKKWQGDTDAWTDNKILVDKASEMLTWKQCAPANMLTSDWDAVKTIVDTVRELE